VFSISEELDKVSLIIFPPFSKSVFDDSQMGLSLEVETIGMNVTSRCK